MPLDSCGSLAGARAIDDYACAMPRLNCTHSKGDRLCSSRNSLNGSGIGIGVELGNTADGAVATAVSSLLGSGIDNFIDREFIHGLKNAELSHQIETAEALNGSLGESTFPVRQECLRWKRSGEISSQLITSAQNPNNARHDIPTPISLRRICFDTGYKDSVYQLGAVEDAGAMLGIELSGRNEGSLSTLAETLQPTPIHGLLGWDTDGEYVANIPTISMEKPGEENIEPEGFNYDEAQVTANSQRTNMHVSTNDTARSTTASKSGNTKRIIAPKNNWAQPGFQEQASTSVKRKGRRGRPSQRPSCALCKIRRHKCSGNLELCDKCRNSRIYAHLCIAADFKQSRSLDRSLYGTRIQILLDNVARWLPSDPHAPKTIDVSNGFGPSLELTLRPYIPKDENLLTHVIFRDLQGVSTVPTARSTAFSLDPNVLTDEKIDSYCDELAYQLAIKEARGFDEHSQLVYYVLMFATIRSRDDDVQSQIKGVEVLRLALRFWAMQAVFFKYPWTIQRGGSQIGMHPLKIPGFWSGKTLLPRLVNQELDRVFEKRMEEIERMVLEGLQKLVYSRHREYWCAIFLTSFILLHSLEKDSWNLHAWEYEKKRPGGMKWPLCNDPSEYYRQNKHIADTVITHFRIVSQGHTPFALDWSRALNKELLGESSAALTFVSSIQRNLVDPQSGRILPTSW